MSVYGSYHGEKLQAFTDASITGAGAPATVKKPRTRRSPDEVFISTIYDDHDATDPPEPLLRRAESTQLKYRQNAARRH